MEIDNNLSRKIAALTMVLTLSVLAAAFWFATKKTPSAEAVAGQEVTHIDIQSVDIGSCRIPYFSFGTGERALVILPGASITSVMLSADAVAAAYGGFSEDYTVYTFDYRPDLPDDCTVRSITREIADAMQVLGITDADVFGCSLGGMVAQALAVDFPELVHKLVLASTLAQQNETSIELFDRWNSLSAAGDVRALNRDFQQNVYSAEYFAQYRDIFLSLEEVGTPEDLSHFIRLVHACRSFDLYEELDRISCPVLVIGAWGDRALSPWSSLELAEKLQCDLFMYKGYSHAVYDEAPDYKDRLSRFFAD